MATRNWLITGASRGLGRVLVETVLEHGDRVVATARTPHSLADELTNRGDQAVVLPMDVDDSSIVSNAVQTAIAKMGQIDVLVNNAGYAVSGGVEEVNEVQARAQFDTNFFGALWTTRAVLPHMRARRSGHIIQISSIAGLISAPGMGLYAASKWALEAMSEALAGEVAPLGLKVTLIEPSGMPTDWAGNSMQRATPISDYDEVLAARRRAFDSPPSPSVYTGDLRLISQRIIDVVEDDQPPLRLVLGNVAFDLAMKVHKGRLADFELREEISRSIDAVVT